MSENEAQGKDRIIDLRSKKTEDECAYAAQSFFEKFTPLWFKWLGWLFTTGAVAYLAEKTASKPLKAIEAISYVLLTWYFLYLFASIRIEPYHSWASSRASKMKRLLALLPIFCLVVAFVFGTRQMISYVIEQIKLAK